MMLSSSSMSSSPPTVRSAHCSFRETDPEGQIESLKQEQSQPSVLRLSGLGTDFRKEQFLLIFRINCDEDKEDDEDHPSIDDSTKMTSNCYERFLLDHSSALSSQARNQREKGKEEELHFDETILGLCDHDNNVNNSFQNERNSPSMMIIRPSNDHINNVFSYSAQQQEQEDICVHSLSGGHYVAAIVNCNKNQIPASPQLQQRQRYLMNGQVTGALDWSDSQNDTTIPSDNEDNSNDNEEEKQEEEEEEDTSVVVNNYTDDYVDVQEEEIESKYFGSKYHLMVLMTLVVCIYFLWRYMKRRERARWQEYHTLQLLQQQDEAFDVTFDDEEEDSEELFGYHDNNNKNKKNSHLELVESPSSLGGKG